MTDSPNAGASTKSTRLAPPSQALVEEALAHFLKKRPKPQYLTLVFQLVVNSVDKQVALLQAHKYVTNFKIRVLEALREKSGNIEPNHAFDLVLQMLEQLSRKQQEDKGTGTASEVLGILIGKHFTPFLLKDDYYFSSQLRDGAYRECATMLLGWCSMFIEEVPDEEQNDEPSGVVQDTVEPAQSQTAVRVLPSLERVHELWDQWNEKYRAALAKCVPFGRHKGEMLKQVGKRDRRWILERIPEAEVVEATLAALDTLLGYREVDDPREREAAKMVEHPWRRTLKHERAVRLRHIDMRILDPPGAHILLGVLKDEEKERLRDELLEQKHNRAVFDELRQALEIAIYDRPPTYPTVRLTALPEGDVDRSELLRRYQAAVAWFADPFPTGKTDKSRWEYTPDELADFEADQQGELLKAEAALGLPVLQPLSWKRSLRPGLEEKGFKFALLYDKETGAYVLALSVHGRKRLPSVAKKKQDYNIWMPKHFQPTVGENLHFVNFPDRAFVVPKQASILMFSLLYGKDYHEHRFLNPALERLQTAPDTSPEVAGATLTPVAPEEEPQHSETTAAEGTSETQSKKKPSRGSKALIASARVVCRWSEKDGPRFFAHLPIRVPVPTSATIPTTVLGVHEHRDGYSYAVLSLDGSVRAFGDLDINPAVLPHEDDTAYNPNYAMEVATSIVKLAETYNSYIGVEDTSYKRQAGLSRVQNREFFSRPSRKVIKILDYKAQLNERHPLMRPREIDDISEARDCSRCHNRMPEGYQGVRRVTYVECPECQGRQPWRPDVDDVVQECQTCGMSWRAYEGFVEREFVCGTCNEPPIPARYNTALVVAQQTLVQLVNHHVWRKEHSADGRKQRSTRKSKRPSQRRRSRSK
jgi:hypothetical protein